MASRKPAKITKPIIFYNDFFHYVEDNNNGEADDNQFALFKVYNLTRSFGELCKEIIVAVGGDESATVTLVDDFAKSDSSSENSMDDSYIALGEIVKIRICFKSQKHRDVIEQLRSTQAIKDLTHNGFADWVPLDSKSYINIERNSKCERSGNIINATKLRSFDNDIDPRLLGMIIEEICENKIELALEKLFPGPIITIYREVNDVTMRVVFFEIHYGFDEEMGKLFVEVLNFLIEDRKIEARREGVSPEYSTLVYRLFAVIRNLIHLNELYGEFKLPSWTPFINNPKLKEIRDKDPVRTNDNEEIDLSIVEFESLDVPLKKLHPLVKQLQREVETAQHNISDSVRKWKNPKRTSNLLFYGSIATIMAVPAAYFSNYRTANAVSSNRLKISFGCLLSIVLGIWSRKSHHEFHKAIKFTKQIDPLLDSTKNNIELLEQWLNRIGDGESIQLNDYEFKGRKIVLKQLFHYFVLANSTIKNSFTMVP